MNLLPIFDKVYIAIRIFFYLYTVKSAHVVISIKQSPVLKDFVGLS